MGNGCSCVYVRCFSIAAADQPTCGEIESMCVCEWWACFVPLSLSDFQVEPGWDSSARSSSSFELVVSYVKTCQRVKKLYLHTSLIVFLTLSDGECCDLISAWCLCALSYAASHFFELFPQLPMQASLDWLQPPLIELSLTSNTIVFLHQSQAFEFAIKSCLLTCTWKLCRWSWVIWNSICDSRLESCPLSMR